MNAVLETRHLTLSIGAVAVCRDLSLRIEPGQCWGVLGRNGTGKSTLLHTLAGLRAADAGAVLLDGAPLTGQPRRQVARRLGVLFQEYADPFPSTVLETALTGRHPHLGAWDWEGPEDLELARAALARTGLTELAGRAVNTLSGGERRRLACATLFTQAPALYLLDEPANHLDLNHQMALFEELRRQAREEERAVCMVLHDPNLAVRYCDHLLLLFGAGEALAGPAAALLTATHLERLYHHPLVAVPTAAGTFWLPG